MIVKLKIEDPLIEKKIWSWIISYEDLKKYIIKEYTAKILYAQLIQEWETEAYASWFVCDYIKSYDVKLTNL